MLSHKFISTIKLHELPAYKIAHKAGLNPSTLSKLMCGIERVHSNDPRVVRVGEVIGLKAEECFEDGERYLIRGDVK